MDTLRNNNDIRWTKFDVIYYEYGSMVILYEDSEKAVKAWQTKNGLTADGIVGPATIKKMLGL